jgi:hypothetical protein
VTPSSGAGGTWGADIADLAEQQPAPRPPSLEAAMAFMSEGEGALAVAELQALAALPESALTPLDVHYWLGLAHLLAFDWGGATRELRAYLAQGGEGWRAGWACLHLGRVSERAGRTDEASLAYRGCLATDGAERAARKLAFDLMSRIAGSLPMGYGQAPTRPASS